MDPCRIRTIGIGGKKGELRLANRAVQIGHAVVVLMIPDRRGVVLHRVHRGDDRIRSIAGHSRGDVRQRIALKQVSRVQQNNSARICRAHRIDDRRGPGEATDGFRAICVVVPGCNPAMHIGRRSDHEVHRRHCLRDLCGRARNQLSGKARNCEKLLYHSKMPLKRVNGTPQS